MATEESQSVEDAAWAAEVAASRDRVNKQAVLDEKEITPVGETDPKTGEVEQGQSFLKNTTEIMGNVATGIGEGAVTGAGNTVTSFVDLGLSTLDSLKDGTGDLLNLDWEDDSIRKSFLKGLHIDNVGEFIAKPDYGSGGLTKELPKALSQFLVNYITFGKALNLTKTGRKFQKEQKHLSTVVKGAAADATAFYGEGNMSEYIQNDPDMQQWIKENKERYPEGVWENVTKLVAGSMDWTTEKLQTDADDTSGIRAGKHALEGALLGEMFEAVIRTVKWGGKKLIPKDFSDVDLEKGTKKVESKVEADEASKDVNVVDDAVDAVDDAVDAVDDTIDNPYRTDEYIDEKRGVEFEANSKDISGSSDVVSDIVSELGGTVVKPSVKGVDTVLDDAQLEELYSTVFTPEKQTVSSAVTDVNYKSNRLPRSVEPLITWAEGFFKNGGKNFDPGGGAGELQTARLGELDVENVVLDPFNRSKEHNIEAIKKVANGQADTATVNNLLNVLVDIADRVSIYKQVKNALKEDGQAAFANWRDPKQAKALADAGETSKVRTDKAGNKIAGQTHMADEAYVKELEDVFGKGNVKIVKVPKPNGKGTENIIIASKKTVKETPTPKLTDTRVTWDNIGQYAKNVQALIKEIPNIPKELADKIQNGNWKKANGKGGKLENPLKILRGLTNKTDGVGKRMGSEDTGTIYAHLDYIADVVPKEIFEPMIAALKKAGHNPNLFTFNKKTGQLDFVESLDFDTVHEPSIAARYKVGVGGVVEKSTKNINQLYHHKWLWVKNDYKGFNYADEKIRSINWLAARGDDWTKSTTGSIGKKENWEKLWEEKISPNLVRISKGMDEAIDDIAEEGADALDNSIRPIKGVRINRDEYNEFIKRLNKGEVSYDDSAGIDFNFDRIDSEGDIKAIINLLSEVAEKTIDKAKGGVRTFDETEAIAELVGTKKEDLTALYKQTKNLDSKILAFRQLLNSSSAEMDRLTKLVAKPNHLPADEVAMRRQAAIDFVIQAEVKGIQTNVARALNAMKIAARTGNYFLMIDELGGSGKASDWAEKYQKLAGAKERANHVRNTALGRVKGVIEEWWINSLLSGIPTQVVNFIGNNTMVGINVIERIGAGTIGSFRRAIGTGDARSSTSLTEAYHSMRGMALGLQDAGRINLKQLKTDTGNGFSSAMEILRNAKGARGKVAAAYDAIDEIINNYKGSTITKTVGDEIINVPAYGTMWRTMFTGNPILDNMTKIESSGVDRNAITSGNLNPRGALANIASSDTLDFQTTKDLFRFGLGVGLDMLGKIVRTPGRTLIATDEFFKGIAYRGELHEKAYNLTSRWAEGIDKVTKKPRGIKAGTEEFNKHYEQLLKEPPQELHITALEKARYQTFTNELGGLGSMVQRLGEMQWYSIPAGKFIVPFVRTPINIFKVSLERVPLIGLAADSRIEKIVMAEKNIMTLAKRAQRAFAGKEGGAARDEIIARWGIFTAVAMQLEEKFADGTITGAGHRDKDVRATAKTLGLTPYTIKFGDKRYAYNRLDPVGGLLGAMADFHLISNLLEEADESLRSQWIDAMFLSFEGNFMSKTYIESIQNITSGLMGSHSDESYKRRFGQVTSRLFSSFYPTFLAQRTRTGVLGAPGDSEVKQYFDWFDAFKARIPGYSSEIMAKRDFLGKKVSYDLGGSSLKAGFDFVSPIFVSQESDIPIAKEVLRLKIGFGKLDLSIDGIRLSAKSWDNWGMLAGRIATNDFNKPERKVGSQFYNSLTDGDIVGGIEGSKADYIKSIVNKSRNQAKLFLLFPYLNDNGFPTKIKTPNKNPYYDKALAKQIDYKETRERHAMQGKDVDPTERKKLSLKMQQLKEVIDSMKKDGSID